MLIFVKTLTGRTIVVEIEMFNTINDLKQEIYRKTGLPVAMQRIIVCGRQPMGTATMGELEVQKINCLHLVLKLRAAAVEQAQPIKTTLVPAKTTLV